MVKCGMQSRSDDLFDILREISEAFEAAPSINKGVAAARQRATAIQKSVTAQQGAASHKAAAHFYGLSLEPVTKPNRHSFGAFWRIGQHFVYGLLPDVSKEVNDRRIDRNRMQSYIRPVVELRSWPSWTSARRGPNRDSDLERSRMLSAWLGAGPTGHAMIMLSSLRISWVGLSVTPRRRLAGWIDSRRRDTTPPRSFGPFCSPPRSRPCCGPAARRVPRPSAEMRGAVRRRRGPSAGPSRSTARAPCVSKQRR